MPKKNNYSGNKQNDRSSSSWIPTSILDSNDLHSSSMTQSKLDEIKSLFSFKVNAVVPAPNHTVDWFLHGWVCFYSYPFDMEKKQDEALVLDLDTTGDRGWKSGFFFAEIKSLGDQGLRSPTGYYLRNTFVTLLVIVSLPPSSFTHILEGSLLPQTGDGYKDKTLDQILVDSAGHSFHVIQAASLAQKLYRKRVGQFHHRLIWATAEDLARNRGRVLSLYLQLLRSLNSPNLPLNFAARLHKKAEVRAIFMLTSEERSLYNVDDLIDTGRYALSLLRKGEIPKYIQ
ncbi:hypothetical protein POM88_000153 [Heracleum sosnowskyi]|uniref:LYR motif containing domain-containing protein n=1 Tax=Heracleum sosnowskyi TaxID=360622 RepID=A0AAD8NAL7_9APIA|nr:hypothetical protein POM88_000153 [Heracleum sosnowskyi]